MDAAISGTAMANRPGLLNALAAAEWGEFDVLLAEDEDRIARDEEHQWNVYNRLTEAGVFMATVASKRILSPEAVAQYVRSYHPAALARKNTIPTLGR
jgi:DNA invertase Pin-like site-specific DNA recombinase